MVVAVALAALAVVVAVVLLASGMGGELAEAHPDHPPLPLPGNRPIAGTDAALLRLPMGVWGYHVRVTDEGLRRLAYALTERDTRIAILEQQIAELRHKLDAPSQRPAPWLTAPEPEPAPDPAPGPEPAPATDPEPAWAPLYQRRQRHRAGSANTEPLFAPPGLYETAADAEAADPAPDAETTEATPAQDTGIEARPSQDGTE